MEYKYAVVITFSFDADVNIQLFKEYEDAIEYLRKDFENEKRIAIEENEWEINEDLTGIQEDGSYAILAENFTDGIDKTEWHITSNINMN